MIFANSCSMRSFASLPTVSFEFLMFAGQKVEQQAVERPAIDKMTLPLPADKAEIQALYGPH
jgi:hypothetical protein